MAIDALYIGHIIVDQCSIFCILGSWQSASYFCFVSVLMKVKDKEVCLLQQDLWIGLPDASCRNAGHFLNSDRCRLCRNS